VAIPVSHTFQFVASQPHWQHHLRPVYDALEESERGGFSPRRSPITGSILVTASFTDYRVSMAAGRGRPVVLFEHGAGFSFSSDHPSYAGGKGREKAAMLPAPNRWVQTRNLAAYPGIPAPIVGVPKMDALSQMPDPDEGIVAISFHWECQAAPETRSALEHYRPGLAALAKHFKGRIIGHGHPKAWHQISSAFRRVGIPPVQEFQEVVRRASVYVNDCSSTLYEFAALGRPVVVMNAPFYRRDVHHGLRFWDHADVGVEATGPKDLIEAIEEALEDRPQQQARRRAAVEEVYPHLGQAVERAVSELRDWAAGHEHRDVQPSTNGHVPAGFLTLWQGVLSAIPDGYLVCDGTRGTPDLRRQFVKRGSRYDLAYIVKDPRSSEGGGAA
jgi:hypothetical protein